MQARDHGPGPAQHAIVVPDAYLLFCGDYKRAGLDLVLSKDGHDHVVHDYFKSHVRAPLASPDGAQLSGALVDALMGEIQVAQLAGGTTAATVIGRVTKLTGSATAIRNGVSIQLNMGDTVNKGDVVQAGAESSLGLTFIDGTVFGLSANARMVLNEMVYDPNGSSNASLLSLVQGTITFVAGETAKHGDMKIDTPVATMGIRGTAVLVEIAFNVPGGDPSASIPVKFQVLREPDGSVGSYVLYSKTDPTQAIATINRAGEVTSYNANGVLSIAQVAQLAPEAKAIVDQTLQSYFPTYTPSPQSTTPGGSPPADPRQGAPPLDPLKFTPPDSPPVGPPITVPINLPGATPGTPPVNVTITRFNAEPTIVVTPVVITLPVDKTSFSLADQVAITDPDNAGGTVNDVAVPYVTGSGKLISATGPSNGPASTDLAKLVAVDPVTGHVTYDPAAFKFLPAGKSAVFTIGFDSRSGPDTIHETITFTVDGSNDAPVVAAALTAAAHQGDVPFTTDLLAGASDADLGETASLAVTNVTYTVGNGIASTTIPAGVSLTGAMLSIDPGNPAFAHLALGETTKVIVSYDVADIHGATVTQTETITVTGTNDAPVVAGPLTAAATQGGTAFTLDLLADASDVDSGETATLAISNVSYRIGNGPATTTVPAGLALTGTTLGIDPANTAFDHLALGETTVIVVTYDVTDVHGATVAQTETLTVTGTNDAPVITAASTPTVLGIGYDFTLHANFIGQMDPATGAVTILNSFNFDTGSWQPSSFTASATDLFATSSSGLLYDFDATTGAIKSTVSIGTTFQTLRAESNGMLIGIGFDFASHLNFLASVNPGSGAVTTLNNFAFDSGFWNPTSFTLSSNDVYAVSSVGSLYDFDITTGAIKTVVTLGGTPPLQSIVAEANGDLVGIGYDFAAAHNFLARINPITGAVTQINSITFDTGSWNPSSLAVSGNDLYATSSSGALYDFDATTGALKSVVAGGSIFQAMAGATRTTGAVSASGTENAGSFAVNLLQHASDVDDGAVLHVANLVWTDTGVGLPTGFTLSPDGNSISVDTGDAAYNQLAQGQSLTRHLSYDIVDEHGALVHQTATITITGSNDAPTVAAALAAGANEGAAPFTVDLLSGAFDVDSGDGATLAVRNVTYAIDNGTPSATLPAGLLLTGAMLRIDPANAVFDHLALGETTQIVVSYNVSDMHGATVAQTETITITGTNDAPVIDADGTTATDRDRVSGAEVAAGGAILFSDVDLTDTHTACAVHSGSGTALGNLTLSSVSDAFAPGAPGEFDWSYSATTAMVEAALLASATGALADTFDVTIYDGHGGTVSLGITIDLSANLWSGGTGNWNSSGNWSLGHSPTASGIVLFNSSADVTLDGAFATAGLLIAAEVTAALSGANKLEVTGQTINQGSIVVASDATLQFDGAIDNSAGAITIESGGTLTLDGATISGGTITDVGTPTFGDAINLIGSATISDGTLYNSGEFTVSGTGNALVNEQFTNYATMSVLAGGVLTLTNSTVSGGYLHNAGTLHVEGSTGATLDGVTVDGCGILQVDDEALPMIVTLTLSGGATIENGTLSIGDVGAIDISDSATFYNETVVNSGVISVFFGATLTLDNVTIGGGELDINGTLQIAAYSTVTLDSDTISEGESGLISVGAGAVLVIGTDDADLNIAAGSNAVVNVSGSNETLHITGDNVTVNFTGTGNLVFVNDALVSNGDHAAEIGAPTNADVTEDATVPTLTAVGSISISDADAREGSFRTTVTGAEGNLGHLVLAADGSYSYSVANADVQYLAATGTHVDSFTVTTLDGTSRDVNFTIHGVNDAPVVATGSVTSGTIDVSLADSTSGTLTPGAAAILAAGPGLISGIGGATGYGNLALPAGDDNSSGAIDITSIFGANGVNFFGSHYTSIYVNNNGNITFGSPNGAYTPSTINAGFNNPIIAAFWADVDTRGHGAVYYDLDSVDGVMTITWDHVGYYSDGVDKLNSFQIVLANEGGGNFDIEYRYADINWTTGSASGGSGGLGGTPARAGYSAGDGVHYYELPQSGDQNALLHLPATPGNTGVAGVDGFQVHDGSVGPSMVTSSGAINFSDSDLSDVHTAYVDYTGNELGTLTLSKVTDTTGTGANGQFAWTYTADTATVKDALQDDADGVRVDTFHVIIDDGHGGTVSQTVSVTLNGTGNHAPFIETSNLQTSAGEQQGAPFTLSGISVSDVDSSSDGFVLALAAGHGRVTDSNGNALPGSFTSLADLNAHLSGGLVYTGQEATPQDSVTLAVRDSQGASSTVNFIFNVSQTGPVTLNGTAGNDVIIGTGHQDTMTGGAGRDHFVFAPNFGSDTITDFNSSELDQIDLRSVVTTNDLSTWIGQHALASPGNAADTLIHLDGSSDTILLKNVAFNSLHASDFIVGAHVG